MKTQTRPSSKHSTCTWDRKRPFASPFPLNFATTVLPPQKKRTHHNLLRTASINFTDTFWKRPSTDRSVKAQLTIVGRSNIRFKEYDSEVRSLKSSVSLKRHKLEYRQSNTRTRNQYSSNPKQDNSPFTQYNHVVDQILCKNSAKLVPLCEGSEIKNKTIVLILSAEFVLQESRFWMEDEIDQEAAKTWKKLQSMCSVVWIIKRERSLRKINAFGDKMQLGSDAIYLLRKPKRKKVITVNLMSLEQSLGIKSFQKVVYVDFLDDSYDASMRNFLARLPIGSSSKINVHFLQSNHSAKQLFSSVPSILTKEGTVNLDVTPILTEYKDYLSKFQTQKANKSQRKQAWIHPEQEDSADSPDEDQVVLQRISELKSKWIKQISTIKKLQSKEVPSQKDSIPYTVGDLLKRNFSILGDLMRGNRKASAVLSQTPRLSNRFFIQDLKYNIPLSLWKL